MTQGEETVESLEVLVVDDDATIREALGARLESWGHATRLAADRAGAREELDARRPDLLVLDVVLPDGTGLDLLREIRDDHPRLPVILVTAHEDVDVAVEAMKLGAADFLTKPVDADKFRALLGATARDLGERRRVRALEERLADAPGLGEMVGATPRMRSLFETVELLARNEATCLVVGESGTGKELVARSIHELGPRAGAPFVAVNCAAIPETLMESELFGHEKGAFTGATRTRAGCFERADGGVLFLDEIVEMPTELQPKLLRVLEDGRVRRVGGDREAEFDIRVVAATNRDPETAIAEGDLREDLYYRLSVFELRVPPLRERADDIPLLVQAFVGAFNRKHETEVEGVREEALDLLRRRPWPGNVRELRNVIERSVIVAGAGLIDVGDLPPYLREDVEPERRDDAIVVPLGTPVREAERRLILRTLEDVGNNKAEAARRLGLDPKTIRNKLKRWEGEEGGEDGGGASR